MSELEQQICPWCQMEIIWDPEFGPEEECPHCLNELKGYRSLPLNTAIEHESDLDEDEDTDSDEILANDTELEESIDEDDYEANLEENKAKDIYHEGVMKCLDTQLEVPECFRCQELMLLSGVQTIDSSRFVPEIPVSLGQSFLPLGFKLQLYVCPSCFSTESMLANEDREFMIKVIKENQ
jgi:hypothetical protein